MFSNSFLIGSDSFELLRHRNRVLVAVVYDGHARNTANLGPSVFVTFSVASATELPADLVLVFFLDRWGRRALAFGSLIGAAAFSLATLAVPMGKPISILKNSFSIR